MPNRSEFLTATGAAAAAPAAILDRGVKPVVIASSNGNRFKNGGTQTAVERAFVGITRGDDVLDALIAGVNIVELDPLDDSVGYGGLPNADGVVQLDASCMHGPKHRAGAVGALEGVRTPSLVAKAVMEQTDHVLLVGRGAQEFARDVGFTTEPDLNTAHSRALWLEWKRRTDPDHYLDPAKRALVGARAGESMIRDGLVDVAHYWGTINCDGINARGDLCGVTTTSGLAWKIPGRVGDSPIIGAGLYVDNEVGAAGSTGRGEANLYGVNSMFIVERMRAGRHPKDAAMDALRRVRSQTIERRLLNSRGNPRFGLQFYALDKRGRFAGVSLYRVGEGYALCDENGPRSVAFDHLLEGAPFD
ncbi:MAG: N(4)-(beta-N-acetylglucosaminyl)-L-asparaginase [Candidatus Eremiobacteraeota bacterium]|nr:N(4)-(beta-N-acetylglucosaminyl)-L-asparaginase [Candidatus Eremiobacteraeota bacterium]MBC5821855.1 N(4)-(beta-N-acetylglucosaminyl)-L-asparaginase [Candidatus Eremiobacteraeota bacterium]